MFEDRLKKLRDAKGWTQKETASMLNINPRTYASYENNEREPNSEILILLSNIFDVSVDYLLGLDKTRILSKEIGRKTSTDLTKLEIELINNFRQTSYEGKRLVIDILEMCKSYYPVNETPDRDEIIKRRISAMDKLIAEEMNNANLIL